MRRRLIALLAVAALLLLGAAPVSAAPGGVPGPPTDHGKSVDKGDDAKAKEWPDGANAYGKKIKDEYGMPYGHLQQCARYLAGDTSVDVEADADAEEGEDEKAPRWIEDCESLELPALPDGEHGAKAFFLVFTDMGTAVVAI